MTPLTLALYAWASSPLRRHSPEGCEKSVVQSTPITLYHVDEGKGLFVIHRYVPEVSADSFY